MHPELLRIGGFVIYTYGLLVAAAVGLVAFLGINQGVKRGFSETYLYNLVLIAVLAGVVGGRLVHVAAEWGYYRKHFLETVLLRQGGLAVQGALIFGLLAGAWYLWKKKLPVLAVSDVFFVYIPLGQAVGRLGCFFNGCCYGKTSNLPWAVQFPSLPGRVLPTELYYSAADLALFALLFAFNRSEHKTGEITGWYFILYGLLRSVLDNYRGDLFPGFLGFYTSQWYAILFALIGMIILLKVHFTGGRLE